ncbi:MAG: L-aspartate oxidase [Candidatus Longimicrobiales bacterium M2_2A_002]
MRELRADVLVIGSGIAGLTFALEIADHASVLLVTKKRRADSNTNHAQGGIAAVMSPADSFESHVRDTLEAGAGLCHEDAVRELVREGPDRVRDLMEWGADFTTSHGELALGREGGHSHRRIVHAKDLTGREIEHALLQAVADHPSIETSEDHLVLDLLVARDGEPRCGGALVFDHRHAELATVRARATFLATGGLSRVYRHTTNPAIATGDGVAMAFRAGATVANLEFVQFHPTALYPAEGQAILISEAVRGEGAVLRTMDGDPVMAGHPMGSLATRDVVAREIDRVLKETGAPHVLLDISEIGAAAFRDRFPYIVEACAARGVDVPSEPIPVVPAAHYACGGVRTDRDGRTDLPGLMAAGEVACTGVHGANRLASNSLLEAVVFSHRAARALESELAASAPDTGVPPVADPGPESGEWKAVQDELRSLMWDDCGIVRSDERLAVAEHRIRDLRRRADALWRTGPVDTDLAETRNLCDVALLIVRSARSRTESRGLHYNVDHPETDANQRADTVLRSDED